MKINVRTIREAMIASAYVSLLFAIVYSVGLLTKTLFFIEFFPETILSILMTVSLGISVTTFLVFLSFLIRDKLKEMIK